MKDTTEAVVTAQTAVTVVAEETTIAVVTSAVDEHSTLVPKTPTTTSKGVRLFKKAK